MSDLQMRVKIIAEFKNCNCKMAQQFNITNNKINKIINALLRNTYFCKDKGL